MIDANTVQQTLSMFDEQNLDVRAVTLGISLQSCVAVAYRDEDISSFIDKKLPNKARRSSDLSEKYPELLREADYFAQAIYRHIISTAANFAGVVDEIAQKYGIKVANKRISVTPIGSLVSQFFSDDRLFGEIDSYDTFKYHEMRPLIEEVFLTIGSALDEARVVCKIDVLGGFSALVQKGMTRGERFMIYSVPHVLANTKAVCSSINVATTRAGINMDAVALLGTIIHDLAKATSSENSFGCCKLVIYANMPEDNPYMAGAIHGPGEPDAVINVGVSGPGVILGALKSFIDGSQKTGKIYSLGDLADVIKHAAFKVTKVGELIGIEVAQNLSAVEFGAVDVSLAPTYKDGDSVAQILEKIGITRVGMPGTTAALAMLTDAVKKGGTFASKFVGGMSGAFIPVSEDRYMEAAYSSGALTLEKLEAMTSVCSVGLDMIAIKADEKEEGVIDPSIWSGIIADEIAVGVFGGKTTAVRIIPVFDPRYKIERSDTGDTIKQTNKVVFQVEPVDMPEDPKSGRKYACYKPEDLRDNLWGEAVPMPLNKHYLWENAKSKAKNRRSVLSSFSVLGGRIPASIHSLKN